MRRNSIIPNLRSFIILLSIILTACSPLTISASKGNSPTTSNPATSIPNTGGNPSVTVHDQETDGTSVLVEDAYSQGPGWMVIHNQQNGTIGQPIGETQLNRGDNRTIVVKIDPAQATSVMYAMLHVDAGTVGKYEFPGPDVPVMSNGQMVSPAFSATILPAVTNTSSAAGMSGMSMATPSGNMSLLVKVSDQPLVGDTVIVDEVVSSGPGWVVIYTTNTSGQPDQPIGHAAVSDGDNQMVVVQVDPTKATGMLYVQLHQDKGKVGTFEYPGVDAPVMVGVQMISNTFKMTSGQSLSGTETSMGTMPPMGTAVPTGTMATMGPMTSTQATAPASLQPSISVSDQQIQNGSVSVQQVVSNGNWWLVIHPQNPDGTMGEYIGATLLKNGVNTNVVVKIDINRATPVLYAMLHEDHGTIGALEFPGPDVPVMANGQMVAPAFKVVGLPQDMVINIRKISNNVSVLTDGQGNSLYISSSDGPNKSNCSADCQKVWSPLLVNGRLIAGNGVAAAKLAVILLTDGTRQATYLGAPLYYYSKDINPGDTNGQGIGGLWFMVTP